ncbi:MAG: hypothetical protein AB7J13_04100 [Pyrinomonadaceae bacterium]
MKPDMAKFHENNKRILLFSRALMIVLVLASAAAPAMGQDRKMAEVEETVHRFLETWLIKGEVDSALASISESPAFPSCWVDPGESLKWREKRKTLVAKVRPVFARLARDTRGEKRLSDVIESPTVYFGQTLVDAYKGLFKVIRIDENLRPRFLTEVCGGREKDNSKFFVDRINKEREMYLVLFDFKAGQFVTMLWIPEGGTYRLFSLEFPQE